MSFGKTSGSVFLNVCSLCLSLASGICRIWPCDLMVVLVAMPTAGKAVVILMPLNSLSEPQSLDTKNQHYKIMGPNDVGC